MVGRKASKPLQPDINWHNTEVLICTNSWKSSTQLTVVWLMHRCDALNREIMVWVAFNVLSHWQMASSRNIWRHWKVRSSVVVVVKDVIAFSRIIKPRKWQCNQSNDLQRATGEKPTSNLKRKSHTFNCICCNQEMEEYNKLIIIITVAFRYWKGTDCKIIGIEVCAMRTAMQRFAQLTCESVTCAVS